MVSLPDMSAVQTMPSAGPGDRLSITLFFAAAIHALIIFGIGFRVAAGHVVQTNSVEVILVQNTAESPPQEADLIAQANQWASGLTEHRERPRDFTAGLSPTPTPGIAPLRTLERPPSPASERQSVVARLEPSQEQLATDAGNTDSKSQAEAADTAERQREMEIAQLTAELAQRQHRYSQRPRINYVDTLSAKTAVEAAYLKEWVNRVEQIGNLNYPDQARRAHLSGSLILHVLLDHRGRLVSLKLGSSSGQQILDDAARHIVALASPFNPFPDEMRGAYDQLMITRTWVFRSGNSLITR